MKVIALGILSGATGDREKGEEFVVDAELGTDLVGRGLVKPATEPAPAVGKATKAKE